MEREVAAKGVRAVRLFIFALPANSGGRAKPLLSRKPGMTNSRPSGSIGALFSVSIHANDKTSHELNTT